MDLATILQRASDLLREKVDSDNPLKIVSYLDGLIETIKALGGNEPKTGNSGRKAALYQFDDARTARQRQRDNNEAISIIDRWKKGELKESEITDEQKAVLAKYSGNGGGIVGADGKVGSAHEYYTPAPISAAMWDCLKNMGFSGGKVLDPCSGSGIFGALAPENAAVQAVEMDSTSAGVNHLVNGAADYSVKNQPFEEYAAATPDNVFDAIATNVPFADNALRVHKNKDAAYKTQTLHGYFILRSLDKLKYGGLAAFIVPTQVLDGKGKNEKLRQAAALKAEFLGAYRLPNAVFSLGATGADVATDIIFFRKHSQDATDKIAELMRSDAGILAEANVFREAFISGKWFKEAENKKFILGTEEKVKTRWGNMATKVVSNQSMNNIAQAVKPFGESAINWDLLGASESEAISYNDGDIIHQDGKTLKYENGRFVEVGESDNEQSSKAIAALDLLESANKAFHNGANFANSFAAVKYFRETSQQDYIPKWVLSLIDGIAQMPESKQEKQFKAALAALAVKELLEAHETAFNFKEAYPALSEFMAKRSAIDKALPKHIQAAYAMMKSHYSRDTGYSKTWLGENSETEKTFSKEQKIEQVQYAKNSLELSADEIRAAIPDFNPLAESEYVITDETGGKVMKADDYFVGNYGDKLAEIDAMISKTQDAEVIKKLNQMKAEAASRVKPIDVEKIDFDLRTPFVTPFEKAAFLRTVNQTPTVTVQDGKVIVQYNGDAGKSLIGNRKKFQNRLTDYIDNGNAVLRTAEFFHDNGQSMERTEAFKAFREFLNEYNAKFNIWVHANPVIMERLKKSANQPENLFFEQVSDESPLAIDGINPEWKLHSYQAAWVRKQAREFGGINAFNVGLGKSFSSLAAVQYAQNVGTKKKTLFVVPSNVFSNWHKEAIGNSAHVGVYDKSIQDRCLWVGVDFGKNGEFNYKSANNSRDLNKILENQHDKVFMTIETFTSIRMKPETAEEYAEFLRKADAAFAENERKAESEKADARLADFIDLLTKDGKNESAPFLEQMGFDSIVIDEAHKFKNGKRVFQFGNRVKGLGDVKSTSRVAADGLAKTWFIRKQSPRMDGVLPLTATPITNSPLEIYSMLTLAKGEDFIKKSFLGVDGADGFMKAVCTIENKPDFNVAGEEVSLEILTGLKNTALLRNILTSAAEIKEAADVGMVIKLPDAEELTESIALTPSGKAKIKRYIGLYNLAKAVLKEQQPVWDGNAISLEAATAILNDAAAELNWPIKKMAAPFSLIEKMDKILLDEELAEQATFYEVGVDNLQAIESAVGEFNSSEIKEKRNYLSKYTKPENKLKETVEYNDSNEVVDIEYTVKVEAEILHHEKGATVRIDTESFATIAKFEKLLEKHKAEVSVNASPRLAAIAANVKNENAHIRAKDENGNKLKFAKQIVFVESIGVHMKLKRILSKDGGIPKNKITFISGAAEKLGKEYDLLDIQNGFNANGDDNKYCIVIANKKAEVGINLQKGCQAIHHASINWTPDSITQRNGRGVRQGNTTDIVNVYYYEADGTFDMYRKRLVESKASWIYSLMDKNGENSVSIESIKDSDVDAIIQVAGSGDADSFDKLQKLIAENARIESIKTAKAKQLVSVGVFKDSENWLSKFADVDALAYRLVTGARDAIKEVDDELNKIVREFALGKFRSSYSSPLKTIDSGLATFFNNWQQLDDSQPEELREIVNGIGVLKFDSKWIKERNADSVRALAEKVKAIYQAAQKHMKWRDLSESSNIYAEYMNERATHERAAEAAAMAARKIAVETEDSFTESDISTMIHNGVFQIGNVSVSDGLLFISDSAIGFFKATRPNNINIAERYTVYALLDYQGENPRATSSWNWRGEEFQRLDYLSENRNARNVPASQREEVFQMLADYEAKKVQMGEKAYFSEMMPEIKQYYPADIKIPVFFDIRKHQFKQPLFPFPITFTGSNTALEKWQEEQLKAVGSFQQGGSDKELILESGLEVIEELQQQSFKTAVDMLLDSINGKLPEAFTLIQGVFVGKFDAMRYIVSKQYQKLGGFSWLESELKGLTEQDAMPEKSEIIATVGKAVKEKILEPTFENSNTVLAFASQSYGGYRFYVEVNADSDTLVTIPELQADLQQIIDATEAKHKGKSGYFAVSGRSTFDWSRDVGGGKGIRDFAAFLDSHVFWIDKDGRTKNPFDIATMQEKKIQAVSSWVIDEKTYNGLIERFPDRFDRLNLKVEKL